MFTIHTAMLRGVEAVPVDVEVSITPGLPGLTIVGMPDASVQESKTRIRCALKACGFSTPRLSVTVSLVPAELKKSGSGFDLPIAVAILAATEQIPVQGLESCLFVGELGLDGSVCEVRGSVAYEMLAEQLGLVFVSAQSSRIASTPGDVCRTLPVLSRITAGVEDLPAPLFIQAGTRGDSAEESALDYADVYDQEMAKRALTIAAAGRHGVLMVGPPGAGKTMLARRLPTILPPLDPAELAETMLLHSVAAEDMFELESARRPFRSPHHSITSAGLIGGGRNMRPGEASLAHHGILFLDELPEFPSNVLQTLRQPLETGQIRLSRAEGAFCFPSDFQLVAAANPCPCGHLGEAGGGCTCSEMAVQRYQQKLAGPLIDRIDLQFFVSKPDPEKVIEAKRGASSEKMRALVELARSFRREREVRSRPEGDPISRLDFSVEAKRQLGMLSRKLGWGGRGIVRVARVARTIADMAEHALVTPDDVFEASTYRPKTMQGG